MTTIESNCPKCKVELEINVQRWNTKTICPACETELLIEFDFYYGDDHEESDIYDVKILDNKNEKYLEFEKSSILNK